jgi:predicted nucleotidyltransferase
MEKTNPIDLPQVAIDYIDSVIKHMKYRRKVRADVREELTAHFIDALADCENDDERQKAAQKLIAEFGDAKLLGKLLRRAKKRCRPLWRTVVARTFQWIGILFLLLIVYIGWFFSGKPAITTDYLGIMNRQVRPVADDSQNAWPLYEQAVQCYIEPKEIDQDTAADDPDGPGGMDEHQAQFDRSPRPLKTLSQQELKILNQWLSDNHQALDFVRQGNQKPYYWQEYKIHGGGYGDCVEFEPMLYNFVNYRHLTYLLSWQGLLNAERGEFKKSFGGILDAYSFGSHLRGQNTTSIDQFLAISMEGMSTNTLRIVLAEYGEQIDAPLLDQVRKRFATMIENEDFTTDFNAAKLLLHAEIQQSFTQPRIGKSHLYIQRFEEGWPLEPDNFDEAKIIFHMLFTHPGRSETLKSVNDFYEVAEKIATATPATQQKEEFFFDECLAEYEEKNIFLHFFYPAPAVEQVVRISYRARIDREATLAVLAILHYQKQHGELPENLDMLVGKGLLKEVPIDPFSDEPLVYRKTDDGFTLYSVGYNFTDDGGVPGTNSIGKPRRWGVNGDAVFWPVD